VSVDVFMICFFSNVYVIVIFSVTSAVVFILYYLDIWYLVGQRNKHIIFDVQSVLF